METLLDILKYILPSLVVFLTVYFMVRSYLDHRQKSQVMLLKEKGQEIILPLRLQAYERMVLFLERISPGQIVFRVRQADMSPAQLQAALLQSLREEYEHNLAQQIYISPEAWSKVKTAREEIIRLINTVFISLDEHAGGNDFAQKVLESGSQMDKNPVQAAVDFLKKEVGQLF